VIAFGTVLIDCECWRLDRRNEIERVFRQRTWRKAPVLGEVGTEICVAKVAENEPVPPELKGVVLVLAPFELAELRLRVTALKARSDFALGHFSRADGTKHATILAA
jgi:hypothetical protein